jgi:GNAT superfamily N-acetyltransferase
VTAIEMSIDIERLSAEAMAPVLDELAELLVDAVDDGASVGFVSPFTIEDARAFWLGIVPDVGTENIVLLGARHNREIIGTVQLRLATAPNGRHRAEVAKLLVHRRARRRGIARRLMGAVETEARARGRNLLVLDTQTGCPADTLYRSLGYNVAGVIPSYAALPSGALASTTILWRSLT